MGRLNINEVNEEKLGGKNRFKLNPKVPAAIIAVVSPFLLAGCDSDVKGNETIEAASPSSSEIGVSSQINAKDVDFSNMVVALQQGEEISDSTMERLSEELSSYGIPHIIAGNDEEMRANLKSVSSDGLEIIAIEIGGQFNRTGQTVVMLDNGTKNASAEALALAFVTETNNQVAVKYGVGTNDGWRVPTGIESLVGTMKNNGELSGTVRTITISPSQVRYDGMAGYEVDDALITNCLSASIVKFACLDEVDKNMDYFSQGSELGSSVFNGRTPEVFHFDVTGKQSGKAVG